MRERGVKKNSKEKGVVLIFHRCGIKYNMYIHIFVMAAVLKERERERERRTT